MTQHTDSTPVYTVLAFCFSDRAAARNVLKEIKETKKLEEYHIVATAVVEVDDKGKSHVQQHGRGGVGAAVGIMAGETLALIGGPAGLLVWAVAGGAIGGTIGHFLDQAFSQEEVEKLRTQLPPNASALLTMAKESETEKITTGLKEYQAAVMTLTLGAAAGQAVDAHSAAAVAESTKPG